MKWCDMNDNNKKYELKSNKNIPAEGFDPSASRLWDSRSNQLSYTGAMISYHLYQWYDIANNDQLSYIQNLMFKLCK